MLLSLLPQRVGTRRAPFLPTQVKHEDYRLPGLADADYLLLQLTEKILEVAENELYTYNHSEHSVWVTPAEGLGGEPKAIRRLKGDNLSQDLIETAVNHQLTEAEAQRQSAQGWVELMDSWARRGLDLNGYFGELDPLARVQENEVVYLVNRWFTGNYFQLRTTANPAARNPKEKLNSPTLQPIDSNGVFRRLLPNALPNCHPRR